MFDFKKCDEICPNCNTELIDIPTDKSSICPKCGREVFPCNACDKNLDNDCNFNKTLHCELLDIQMTVESCPNCGNEILINGNKPSKCTDCGEIILPCSMCPIDFGSTTSCDWTEEKGCFRYPKPYKI
jgi:predicted RNA-binding Zn-ribbon protein involved in translation (DUF1610 family)